VNTAITLIYKDIDYEAAEVAAEAPGPLGSQKAPGPQPIIVDD